MSALTPEGPRRRSGRSAASTRSCSGTRARWSQRGGRSRLERELAPDSISQIELANYGAN